MPSGYITISVSEGDNVLSGVLTELTLLGESTGLAFQPDHGGELLRFRLPTREVSARKLTAGKPIRVHLHPDGIHLMLPESARAGQGSTSRA
jgi:hypothetical protein